MSFLFSSTQTLFSSLNSVSTYCQKRLIKQCLSSAVDTDSLPLDDISIRWGLRGCTLELKDVKLRPETIAGNLGVPSSFIPIKAQIGLLRLSIPTTGSSAIIVEVESADLRLKYVSDENVTHGRPATTRDKTTEHAAADRADITSAADLHAVIDSAPREDKAELEAALPSVEGAFGNFLRSFRSLFANGPSSLARLIKDGALNRLQIKVKDVSLRLDMEVQDQTVSSIPAPMVPISALFSVAEISMGENAQLPSSVGTTKIERKRQITITSIQAFLLSESEVFDSHARFSPPSPRFPMGPPSDFDYSPTSPSDDSKVHFAMMQSTIIDDFPTDGMEPRIAVEGDRMESMSADQSRSASLSGSMQGSTNLSQSMHYSGLEKSVYMDKSMYMSTISTMTTQEPPSTLSPHDTDPITHMPGAFAASMQFAPYGMVRETRGDEGEATTTVDDPYKSVDSARRLLNIDEITINLLTDDHHIEEAAQRQATARTQDNIKPHNVCFDGARRPTSMVESTMAQDFLAYSAVTVTPSVSESRRHPRPDASSRSREDIEKVGVEDTSNQFANAIEIEIPSIEFNCDISCGWLIAKMASGLLPAIKEHETPSKNEIRSITSQPRLKLRLRKFDFEFAGRLPMITFIDGNVKNNARVETRVPHTILHLTLQEVEAGCQSSSNNHRTSIAIGKFKVGCGQEDMVRFNAGQTSHCTARHGCKAAANLPDIHIKMTRVGEVTTFDIDTLPIDLILNISAIDELLSWIGGLSSILDLGSSIASVSTAKVPNPSQVPRKNQSVRFQDKENGSEKEKEDWLIEKQPPQVVPPMVKAGPSTKVNCRVNSMVTHLIGDECSAKFETSALKLINRDAHVCVQIDKVWMGGPYFAYDDDRGKDGKDAAGMLYANNIRLNYLYRPQEMDLDKLLQLLTPSKDKFEPDDDLILDTLFKQRKEAAVFRVSVGNTTAKLSDLEQVRTLASLGEDLEKLTKVTKYLPEDDQPGILAIVQLQEVDIDISFKGLVGDIIAILNDVEAAYIPLPSLTAGKMRSVEVWRNKEHELVGPAVRHKFKGAAEDTPMIMARFISEELDPTVNLKLYGLRVEYHIPTVLAALGIESGETAEELVAEMTKSVLGFAESQSKAEAKKSSESSESITRQAPNSPRRVSVALRDCHVGLGCRRSPARGLFVISSGKFFGEMKEESSAEASLDLKKVSLMIIDDEDNVGIQATPNRNRNVSGDTHIQRLCDLGYVSVSSISSAVITVKAVSMDDAEEKSIDIEVRDNLLILETCADSTQTLITLLNGLSLPTPPIQDQKYRTEVVPIQDMLQSLTADSFPRFTENSDGVPPDSASDGLLIADEGDYVSDFSPVLPDPDPITAKCQQQQPPHSGEPNVLLDSFESAASVASSVSSLNFQEDHFAQQLSVGGTAHRWNSTNNTYSFVNDSKLRLSPLRVRVRDVHVIWNLFDGYDWKRTRDEISKAVQRVQADAAEKGRSGDGQSGNCDDEEASVVGDFLFNSIYIDIPSNRDPQALPDMINHDINDFASETTSHNTSTTITAHNRPISRSAKNKPLRLARSKRHKVTFELKGISADLVVFPAGLDETQSSLDIRVGDLEIFDHLMTSTWKKFATYMRDAGERETGASMVHLEILNVKPVPDLAASEIVLKATVLPLRLHVDQDALDFLTRFFAFKDDSVQPEVLPTEQPFIQRAEINSIPVKLDFKPKRVDYGGLRSGRTTEFMNFFVLDEANMVLRHCIIYGISGFEKLGQTLNDIWMPDVKANQLPGVLAGLAPIKPLVGVGSGFRNLVLVPVKEYKKDGRVVRSLQKGAVSFAKTTTNELVKLGAKLAIGTQTVLQSAESFFNTPIAGGTSSGTESAPVHGLWEDVSIDENEKAHISLYADQPIGVKQGVRGGYASLGRDLTMARNAIVAVPGEITESGSASQAAKAIFKRAPTIILRPAIGASKAVGQTLLGVGNTLDPTQRRRNEDKYKHH